jgi:acyl-CoA synthetase (AMP-forming)/AMP-acid ligase II
VSAVGAPRFPPDVIARYEREGFWTKEVLAADLRRIAKKDPDRELIIDRHGRHTYGQAADLVDRLVRGLWELGIREGDMVVMQLPNWFEGVALYFALESIGAVSILLPPIYRAKEVGYILGLTEAKIAIVTPSFRGFDYLGMIQTLRPSLPHLKHVVTVRAPSTDTTLSFEELATTVAARQPGPLDLHPDPNTLIQIGFTSGSTGDPKGVMHTSNTLTIEHLTELRACGVTESDVIFVPLTIGHQLGMSIGVRSPVVLGAKVVFQDAWDPEKAVELIAREKVTYTATTPTFLLDLVRAKNLAEHDFLPSLRVWLLAGAVVPKSLHDEVHAKMPHLQLAHLFGITEIGGMICKPPGTPEAKALATGLPQPGLEVRVLDAKGNPSPVNVPGELAMQSPSLFLGYYKQPELSAACRTPDNFFLTGDQVRRDEDGWVWVTGRIKDLIKRGGENISPAEIEDIIAKHPKVADVAVVGIPDERLGERVCAFVVPHPNQTISLEEVVAAVREAGAAKQKWPERVEMIDALPRTSIGKVHKAALRSRITGIAPPPEDK